MWKLLKEFFKFINELMKTCTLGLQEITEALNRINKEQEKANDLKDFERAKAVAMRKKQLAELKENKRD